jgi:transcriptional regulator of acetoin/glycerol metabolism
MSPAALVLREVSEGTWHEFASGVGKDAQASELPVVKHWRRALLLGASFEGPTSEEHLLRGAALEEHVERTEFVQHVARAALERASCDVSPRQYVLLLADATGVVVSSSGGGRFSDEARRVRLIPGARWSEDARGTNAIGTAIAEGRPVYVRGSAHLGRRFHDLVCYAAPIFDADGSLVAVLDATSVVARADDTIGDAVMHAAASIMRSLGDRALVQAGAAVRQILARALDRMAGIALLVEPPARVARMNAGARVLFGSSAGARTPGELLGLDVAALAREGLDPQGLSIERAGRRYALHVDPIQTHDRRLIGLLVSLEPASTHASPRRERAAPAESRGAFASVFSEDERLDEALSLARRVADSSLPVLLLAETGAGKELVARAIHASSPRSRSAFVAINCGAIAPSLLESELFGYGSAAFTGAERGGRQGLFAAASTGTLFLDEVAEMPLAMQAALLRVLEDGTYRRVGESACRHVDVRIVSATCQDLNELVSAGAFRRDLFYRLKGLEISLPALRERSDRTALAAHLLARLARERGVSPPPELGPELIHFIERHAWPGNVRELHALLDVSLILAAGGPIIELSHLPPEYRRAPSHGSPLSVDPERSEELAAVEGSTVRRVLGETQGNVSLAARRLGVARSTVYRMMRRHGA